LNVVAADLFVQLAQRCSGGIFAGIYTALGHLPRVERVDALSYPNLSGSAEQHRAGA
jgi:hypothetical protein